jgi:ATP synthase F1 complex assembly factor 1
MVAVSAKYPAFVVPVLRVRDDSSEEVEARKAYEFYFLQWGFHGGPRLPSLAEDPFFTPSSVAHDYQISTILFTPLQEYKMRTAFATPYLALTFYTDLATSHDVVLMRGEITSASTGSGAQYLLRQEDAQLLVMQVQKFYLWGEGNHGEASEGERLLKVFHEKPEEFMWEDLLKHADLTV